MKSDEISEIVVTLCSCLRLSQAKTLSRLVPAAMALSRASLAQLGRTLALDCGLAAKHCIKRVDRFIGNRRVEPIEAMRGFVQWLSMPRHELLVSIDWVDIRKFQCLVMAARLKGRAIPLVWAVYQYEDVYRSQNNLEYGLLHALRTMVPKSVELTILADRGFGRAEMARECQKLCFKYIIRVAPQAYIHCREFRGLLHQFPIQRGHSRLLRDVLYRKERPIRQNMAIVWQRSESEPWYLMTNKEHLRAKAISRVFGKRMTIEEYFRDTKSKRNGFALRLIQIKDSERLSRFLLVLALAYMLLVTIGLHASKKYQPSLWCSNNRLCECSLFTIGKFMQHYPMPSLKYLLKALRHDLLRQNWG